MNRRPALSRATVDRATGRRTDEAWLADAWLADAWLADAGHPAGVLVLDDAGKTAVTGPGEQPHLALRTAAEVPATADRFFLGEDAERAYFAVEGEVSLSAGERCQGLREVGAILTDRDAGLLVTAVALANWHRTHTHCPRCGEPTEVSGGGWLRRCPADGSEHYPRVDPAVIMLVHDGGDRCLLGRQASWPDGRFSTLAGFVEPGESLEHAVIREVAEETGVQVTDVRYAGSQPWPFPSSLMLGFTATAVSADEPRLLDGELEEARWFARAELIAERGPGLPPPVSIAQWLIAGWLES